jgi:hypothetical protein
MAQPVVCSVARDEPKLFCSAETETRAPSSLRSKSHFRIEEVFVGNSCQHRPDHLGWCFGIRFFRSALSI